ncbi:hypothetical protein PMAYCL1PPCAC_27975, partial [Pristionchus mayeri]
FASAHNSGKYLYKNNFRHDMSGPITRSRTRKLEEDKKRTPISIMELPTELIAIFLSFLSIKDRQNARINWRMDGIVLNTKYSVENLKIEEVSEQTKRKRIAKRKNLPFHKYRHEQEILLVKGRSYSSQFIRRILENISIGQLSIKLNHRFGFHCEIYHLLKYFKVDTLMVDSKSYESANSVITRSYLLELANTCTSLNTTPFGRIATPHMLNDLHLYFAMFNGKTKLRCYITEIGTLSLKILRVLGIDIIEQGDTRETEIFNQIFIIKNGPIGDRDVYIFHFDMEIFFAHSRNTGYRLRLNFHETQSSINAAKSTLNARSR